MKELNMQTRKSLLERWHDDYHKAIRKGKSKILNDYIETTGHNRKYIIAELNSPKTINSVIKTKKAHPCKYSPAIIGHLKHLWEIFDKPCGQRLKPMIGLELDRLVDKFKELPLTKEEITKLKTISSSTIDRRLKTTKNKAHKLGFATTKPGYMLKSKIPKRLNNWDDAKIGFTEIDLVAHNGGNSSGQFLNTLSVIDISTQWWEGQAIIGKSQLVTKNAMEKIRKRLPFNLLGVDSDNGSEFINDLMYKYCLDNEILFTRSRANHKNDNAYIEQKNWTHVRKIIGYGRLDTNGEQIILNSLYENELRIYKNFFQVTYKLKSKEWEGAKRKPKYEDILKTPYQRVLESALIKPEIKTELQKAYDELNPAELKRQIEKT